MASRTVVYVDDDIDGGPATEIVGFMLDDVSYSLDVNATNAAGLREALAPYLAVARRTSGRPRLSAKGRSRAERKELAAIRAWARENGFTVNDTGRMPDEVHVAYRTAHGGEDITEDYDTDGYDEDGDLDQDGDGHQDAGHGAEHGAEHDSEQDGEPGGTGDEHDGGQHGDEHPAHQEHRDEGDEPSYFRPYA